MKVRSGDKVLVLAGDYRGKEGEVLKVFLAKNTILVKGINVVKKSVKRSQKHPAGGYVEVEKPIHISNVRVTEERISKNTKSVKKADESVLTKPSKKAKKDS